MNRLKSQIPNSKSQRTPNPHIPTGIRWVLAFGFYLGFGIWDLGFALNPAAAQINMPDPSMIAGKALPAPELPDGTVSVRVVREGLGNNIVGQQVTVTAAGTSKSAATDDQGRSQMTGFQAGATGTATTTVDGEQLTSDPFEVPGSGGIRIILISGLKQLAERKAREAAEAAAAPPVKGVVTFGGDSRVMVEFQNDQLRVFYILEIVNTARSRVDIGGPILLDLPQGAGGASLVAGSSPSATVQGDRVIVTGPFAAGTTSVQIGFALPHTSSDVTLRQKWPIALEQLLVVTEKVGNLSVKSPQFTEQEEVRAANGTLFILAGSAQGLPPGGELTVELSNVPVASARPRQVALGLGLLVLTVGVWAAAGGSSDAEAGRRLVGRRETLYGELVKLEEQRHAGRVDGSKYASRRQRLIADLERVYGELDGSPTRRQGGDEAAA